MKIWEVAMILNKGLNFDHEDISEKQKNLNLIVLNENKKEIYRKLIKIDENRPILDEAVTSKLIKMENSHLNWKFINQKKINNF